MKQKCTDEHVRRRIGDSAFRLAGICVLVLALASSKMLANEPQILPPADTQLAFVREGQIYLIHADGTGLIQLTNSEPGVANDDPAWSRDGRRLAFARRTLEGGEGHEPYEPWDIYVMDADGLNVIQLTHGGYNIQPTWGPEDDTIAFSSFYNGGMVLAVIDTDTFSSQEPTILLDRPGWNAQPAWSPDGDTITFSSDYRAYDFVYDLYAVKADGACCWSILEGPFSGNDDLRFYFQSAWSSNGQSIAVVVCAWAWENCYPDSTIAVANADGSDLREIAQAGGYAKPTWSPDGGWIAFGSASCSTCESSIRFVSVDGGNEGLLMEDGHSPAWRPVTDTLNEQDDPEDPEGPVKEPDEPKKPPVSKLPKCGSNCDKKGKLTRADDIKD